MKKDLTLVILAAGMGSRFGGLKQIEPIGPNGEFIIDYSIFDAKRAGFTKVVFIIKEENYEIFKETIGKRVEDKIDVEYAFQKLEDIPSGYKLPEDRIKPLGTAHAIYAARNNVKENFVIINADDFYGYEPYKVVADYLNSHESDTKEHFCMVGYKTENTLTENGSVKRGICEAKNGYLTNIIESKIEKNSEGIVVAEPLSGDDSFVVTENMLVSMNMFGFTKKMLNILEEEINLFLEKNKNNLQTVEFLIPDVVEKTIKENIADVKILNTSARWYGVTYKEDKEEVVSAIADLIEKGLYPNHLWD